jgi:ubiquitin-conjugating enzyme E2 D/E
MALHRIQKELADIQNEPLGNWTANPVNQNDLFNWKATVMGPADCPYAGGVFCLDIEFPPEYPITPPRLRFTTKVYHPNVHTNGHFELEPNILQQPGWSPALTIRDVLRAVCGVLMTPDLDRPLMPEIARQVKADRVTYDATASFWTRRFAHRSAHADPTTTTTEAGAGAFDDISSLEAQRLEGFDELRAELERQLNASHIIAMAAKDASMTDLRATLEAGRRDAAARTAALRASHDAAVGTLQSTHREAIAALSASHAAIIGQLGQRLASVRKLKMRTKRRPS